MTAKKIALSLLIFDAILITACTISGYNGDDITRRFLEKETVTVFSGTFLALTGLMGIINGFILTRTENKSKFNFWTLSGFGFFYLSLDENFMAHEGLDRAIAKLIEIPFPNSDVDGLALGIFGLVALAVCFKFKDQILPHKDTVKFLTAGGVCLGCSVVCDLLNRKLGPVSIVVEESFKIIGVSMFMGGYIAALKTFLNRALSAR